jgi:hypothetical protein
MEGARTYRVKVGQSKHLMRRIGETGATRIHIGCRHSPEINAREGLEQLGAPRNKILRRSDCAECSRIQAVLGPVPAALVQQLLRQAVAKAATAARETIMV